MIVFYNKKEKSPVYHREGCYYKYRIKDENLRKTTISEAVKSEYRACKYCGGLEGEVRLNYKTLRHLEEHYSIKIEYCRELNVLYIRTDGGFWKIHESPEDKKYLLYHANNFNRNMKDSTLRTGSFHRQENIAGYKTLHKIIRYTALHDRTKIHYAEKKKIRLIDSDEPERTKSRKRRRRGNGPPSYFNADELLKDLKKLDRRMNDPFI